MPTRVLIGWVALGALTFVCRAEEPKEAKLKPTLIFSGSHTAIEREYFAVVTDEAAWKALWEKHRGGEKTLRFTEREQYFDVDFGSHCVVAIFPGGGDSCDITPRKRGEEILIGFRSALYGIEGRLPGMKDTRTEHEKAKEAAVMPYALVVLPRPVGAVVIEQDVRTDKFGAPVWKERKRFPARNDKR